MLVFHTGMEENMMENYHDLVEGVRAVFDTGMGQIVSESIVIPEQFYSSP